MWARRFADLLIDMVLFLMRSADLKETGSSALNQAISAIVSCLAPSLPISDSLKLYQSAESIFRLCKNLRQDPNFLMDYSSFLHRDDVRNEMKEPEKLKDRLQRLGNVYQGLFFVSCAVWGLPIDYSYRGTYNKEGVRIETLGIVAELVFYAQECQQVQHEISDKADSVLEGSSNFNKNSIDFQENMHTLLEKVKMKVEAHEDTYVRKRSFLNTVLSEKDFHMALLPKSSGVNLPDDFTPSPSSVETLYLNYFKLFRQLICASERIDQSSATIRQLYLSQLQDLFPREINVSPRDQESWTQFGWFHYHQNMLFTMDMRGLEKEAFGLTKKRQIEEEARRERMRLEEELRKVEQLERKKKVEKERKQNQKRLESELLSRMNDAEKRDYWEQKEKNILRPLAAMRFF